MADFKAVTQLGAVTDAGIKDVLTDPSSQSAAALNATIGAVAPVSPKNLFPQGGRKDAPAFTRNPAAVVTPVLTGGPSVYWPSVIRIDKQLPSIGHKYAMFVSTDHDTGAGGIYRAYSDDLISWSGWTLVYQDTTSGSQTETPSVWWNEHESLFFMTYQQKGVTGEVAGQVSLLATSPDLTTWTRVGIMLDSPAGQFTAASEQHFGYARVLSLGDRYVALSNVSGGDYGALGISFSNSGRKWVTDPRPIYSNTHMASDTSHKVVVRDLFLWGGEVWGVGMDKALASGDTSTTATVVVGKMRRDLRGFAALPTVAFNLGDLAWETANVRSLHAFVDDGQLYVYYQTDSNIGVAKGAVA